MCVETALSLVTVICDLKRIRHRLATYIQMRLSYVSAMFNVLQTLFHFLHPDADPYKFIVAEFYSKSSTRGYITYGVEPFQK